MENNVLLNAVIIFIFITLILFALIIILLIISYLGKEYSIRKLEYKRYFSVNEEFMGERIYFIEEFSNKSIFPMFKVMVETYIPSELKLNGCQSDDGKNQHFISLFFVLPFTKIKRTHSLKLLKRGYYKLESARINFFGGVIYIDSFAEISVFPEEIKVEYKRNINTMLLQSKTSMLPIINDVFSFSGIREYTGSDAFSLINQKASARMGRVLVNKNDYLLGRKIVVYINMQNGEKNIPIDHFYKLCENAISSAAYILSESYANGFLNGLRINSKMQKGGYSYSSEISTGKNHYLENLYYLSQARSEYGNSINLLFEKDIDDFLIRTEIYFFSVYTDESILKRLNELEKMGNVVNIIDFSKEYKEDIQNGVNCG